MAYTPFYTGGWKDYPNTTTPITAASLNHLEDGIIAASGEGSGASFVTSQGGPRTDNYYFEIYKHNVANATSLSNEYQLTNPYYYYTIEGQVLMTTLDTSGFKMTGPTTLEINTFDGIDGTKFFNRFNMSGDWIWRTETVLLGQVDTASTYKPFENLSPTDPRFLLSRPWATLNPQWSGALVGTIDLRAGVTSIPVSDDSLKFTSADINELAIYFKIVIDQVRRESVG